MSRVSDMWKYFEKTGSGKCVICIKCERSIAISGNTTNMKIHMQRHHPNIYFELERQNKVCRKRDNGQTDNSDDDVEEIGLATPSTSGTSTQSGVQFEQSDTMKSPLAKKPKTGQKQSTIDAFKISTTHEEKITKYLVEFIATELMPFSIVERQGFVNLLKAAQPSYNIPDRKTISNRKIPQLYNTVKDKIQRLLRPEYYYALTTDSWTSTANLPYLSVTAHYIDDDWALRSVCLACRYMAAEQTGENLSTALREILQEWTIDVDSVISCTTDGGRNILNAIISHLQILQIPCLGHVLNLAVKKSFSSAILSTAIEKCKKIQMTFSHSYKINQILETAQEKLQLPKRKFPSFSPTRWWSILALLKMCSEQYLAIISVLSEYQKGKLKNYILTTEETDVLKKTTSLMEFFEEVSSSMASEKFITSSCVVPLVQKIMQDFSEDDETGSTDSETTDIVGIVTEKSLKNDLTAPIKSALQEMYYDSGTTYLFLKKAMFLDPRFKDNEANLDEIKHQLLSEMITTFDDQNLPPLFQEKKPQGLASIFAKKSKSDADTASTTSEQILRRELEYYVNMPEIDFAEDPLLWWKNRKINLPNLSKCAKKYLASPATSVPSERVFSKGGLIVTDRRCSLSNEHVDQLVFLAMNKNYI